jgi:hypothetical protein
VAVCINEPDVAVTVIVEAVVVPPPLPIGVVPPAEGVLLELPPQPDSRVTATTIDGSNIMASHGVCDRPRSPKPLFESFTMCFPFDY